MSAREELARILYAEGAYCGGCLYEDWGDCQDCKNCTLGYADAAIKAGWKKAA